MVFVAIRDRKEIVGVVRGSKDKMRSLFVNRKFHRMGVGQKLVRRFEKERITQDAR